MVSHPLAARSAALAALAALSCATAPGMPPSAPSRLVGAPVPAFQRQAVQGGTVSAASAAGRVLVVEFFAAFCTPCQRLLPKAERVRADHPEVEVIGVSVDEEPEAAAAQVSRLRLGFPVVHDLGRVIAGRFRVTELPATFVVGRDGRVAWAGGPGQAEDDLARAVAAALE